jgi:DNA-binding NarL/FixJ family response regulator
MKVSMTESDLTVAILMDDLSSAKEIASSLRAKGVLAHHYQNLDEFWAAANLQAPDLLFLDVTKMSQGSVQFRTHPRVVDGSLRYVFFSKESTRILLSSTLNLKPYGYINSDPSLSSQVSIVVDRVLGETVARRERHELEQRIQRLQGRSKRLIAERSEAEEFRAHFEFIRNLCAEIESEAPANDFATSLIHKLELWDAISGYGIYELNQSGQKLISPESTRKKYHPFPTLWLGQSNEHGIEDFAQEMAFQVAEDLFESRPVSIRVHGSSDFPDLVLFVTYREERLESFPWDVLESMLSSSLRRLKLFKQKPQYTAQFLPMWEALDELDDLQKETVVAPSRVLCLSLLPLTQMVKKKPSNRFYWASFFNDFFLQLSGRIQKTTRLSLFGPWHVLFFVSSENLEVESRTLQAFVQQFGYWKFFEDNSLALTEDSKPHLSLIPASSAQYLRLFDKEVSAAVLEPERMPVHVATRRSPRLTT